MEDKLTPSEAVRKYCINCMGLTQFNEEKVNDCQGDTVKCPLYPYRMGNKRISVKVFRAYCLYCVSGDRESVDECPTIKCPCYPYRYGSNPARKGMGNFKNLCAKSGDVTESNLRNLRP